MNILITNIELSKPTGTVTYVSDLAVALQLRGHNVEVFTYRIGSIGLLLKKQGINVVTRLNKLTNSPDIIHGHHHPTTFEVIQKFKNAPAIFFLHDRTSPLDHPPKSRQILKYVAVDYNCVERFYDEEIDDVYTTVIHNWVNTNKFKLRKSFSHLPQRALLFSNYATKNNYYKSIDEACTLTGIKLDVLGSGMNTEINNPEGILLKYDLVFGKAKSAIEALSTGASVIVCDFMGLGTMVNQSNIGYMIKYNFGMKTLTRSFDVNSIVDEIKKFDSNQNKLNAITIRKSAAFEKVIPSIIDLYTNTIKEYAEGKRGMEANTKLEKSKAINLKFYFFIAKTPVLKYFYKAWLHTYWFIKDKIILR